MKKFIKTYLGALIVLVLMLPPCVVMSGTIIRLEFFDNAYRLQLAENVRKCGEEWLIVEYGFTALTLLLYFALPVFFIIQLIRYRNKPRRSTIALIWLGGFALLPQYLFFIMYLLSR